jgi:hypothetical protein
LTLNADLEQAVAERESKEAEILPLRRELEEVHTELRNAQEVILAQEEQLRTAQAGSASLEEDLRQQAERLEQAGPAESQGSLERALEESARYKATVSAQQARLVELEELVEGYRELIEGRALPALPEPGRAGDAAGPRPRASWPPDRGRGTSGREHHGVHPVRARNSAPSTERGDQAGRRNDDGVARSSRADDRLVAGRHARDPEPRGEIGLRVNEALHPVSTAVTALDAQLASLDDLAGASLEVSPDGPAPSEPDRFMELPEHPASRDSSDESRYR